MLLAMAVFAWAATLGAGDLRSFALICVLSGAALGADLALPAAMLADLLARERSAGPRAGAWFGLGVLLGSASLVRGTAVFLLPAFVTVGVARRAPRRGLARGTLAAVAGMLLVLVPWTIRNQLRLGYPVLIASDGAVSLWVGNSDVATGGHSMAMYDAWYERFDVFQTLPPAVREGAVVRAETREAVGWMLRNPHRVLALAPAKIYHMYRNDRGAYDWVHAGLGRLGLGRRFNALADAYYFVVLALALVGVRHAVGRAAGVAVALPITVAATTLAHALLFFGSSRFHHPLLPLLCLLAAMEIAAWTPRRPFAAAPAAADAPPRRP